MFTEICFDLSYPLLLLLLLLLLFFLFLSIDENILIRIVIDSKYLIFIHPSSSLLLSLTTNTTFVHTFTVIYLIIYLLLLSNISCNV